MSFAITLTLFFHNFADCKMHCSFQELDHGKQGRNGNDAAAVSGKCGQL